MTAAIAPIASNGPAAAKAAGPSATPASPLSSAMAKHRQELGTLATTLPFFAYTACFLLAPTVIVIVGAFQDRSGNFTLANFNKMFEANTIAAFGTSILVSLASSLIGAVVGALASYALVIGAKPNGLLRRMVSAISSVLAQFGGVMLAFAFIATIGINGIGTMLIKTLTGYTVNPNWLSSLPGLVTIYCYFQIPLMIIIFLPAVDSIRPQWREACESLGGNTFQYWTRVACPILAPRFISAFLLLFASAFSAYATAAALFSQRSILVPLMIQGAMRNELDPNQQGFAQVLAFAMMIVVAIVMLLSHAVDRDFHRQRRVAGCRPDRAVAGHRHLAGPERGHRGDHAGAAGAHHGHRAYSLQGFGARDRMGGHAAADHPGHRAGGGFGPDLPLAVRRRAEHQPNLAVLCLRDSRDAVRLPRDRRGA